LDYVHSFKNVQLKLETFHEVILTKESSLEIIQCCFQWKTNSKRVWLKLYYKSINSNQDNNKHSVYTNLRTICHNTSIVYIMYMLYVESA